MALMKRPGPGLFCCFILLAGCRQEEITVTRAPKENAAAPTAPTTQAPAAVDLHWTAPAGWKAQPAGGMRLASYRVPGPGGAPGDFSVVAIPGDAGGLLANVNRWRGQVGLAPVDEPALADLVGTVRTPAGEAKMASLAGDKAMLAAILERGGQTWFFKLSGEAAVVSGAKKDFVAFLGSLRP